MRQYAVTKRVMPLLLAVFATPLAARYLILSFHYDRGTRVRHAAAASMPRADEPPLIRPLCFSDTRQRELRGGCLRCRAIIGLVHNRQADERLSVTRCQLVASKPRLLQMKSLRPLPHAAIR